MTFWDLWGFFVDPGYAATSQLDISWLKRVIKIPWMLKNKRHAHKESTYVFSLEESESPLMQRKATKPTLHTGSSKRNPTGNKKDDEKTHYLMTKVCKLQVYRQWICPPETHWSLFCTWIHFQVIKNWNLEREVKHLGKSNGGGEWEECGHVCMCVFLWHFNFSSTMSLSMSS